MHIAPVPIQIHAEVSELWCWIVSPAHPPSYLTTQIDRDKVLIDSPGGDRHDGQHTENPHPLLLRPGAHMCQFWCGFLHIQFAWHASVTSSQGSQFIQVQGSGGPHSKRFLCIFGPCLGANSGKNSDLNRSWKRGRTGPHTENHGPTYVNPAEMPDRTLLCYLLISPF